jgi:serine/threonine protein kinase
MSTTDLPGPSLLAGRYRLVERLGAGGMSVVWRGFDEVLGRQVAVKVLPRANSADPAFRRRLRAEAQAAARLSHPHITNVYDYGEATLADGGAPLPFVVMELIDGESLAAVLGRARLLPWPVAVRICAEVAAALAVAHARGIVHRDVTPANVMLTASGAKVVDFGISALIGENDIDPDGSLLGTPAYLAPERLDGGQVSPATDVYAVGLLIYRTLIGQLPWDVGTTTALLRAHQYVEPDPLPPVEGLPPAVSALVGRCLEKLPDDRPASAELAHVLAGVVAEAPPVARVRTPWADDEGDTTILPWQLATADVPRLPFVAAPELSSVVPALPSVVPALPSVAPALPSVVPAPSSMVPALSSLAAANAGASAFADAGSSAPGAEGPSVRPAAFGNARRAVKAGLGVPVGPGVNSGAGAKAGSTAVPPQRSGGTGREAEAAAGIAPALVGAGRPADPDDVPAHDDHRPYQDSGRGQAGSTGLDRATDGPGGPGYGAAERGGAGRGGPVGYDPGDAGPGRNGYAHQHPDRHDPRHDEPDDRGPGDRRLAGRPGRQRAGRVLLAGGMILAIGAVAYGVSALADGGQKDRATAQAVAQQPRDCFVTYAVLADTGKTFKAGVLVTNNSSVPVDDWDLRFVMPGDQQVDGRGAVVKQEGVDVTATSTSVIQPRRTAQVQLTGGYRASNAVPVLFTLNGQLCDARVSPKPGAPARLVPTPPGTSVNPRGFPVGAPSPAAPTLSTGPGGVVVTVNPTPTGTGTVGPTVGPTGGTVPPTASATPPPQPPPPVPTETVVLTEEPPPPIPDDEPTGDGSSSGTTP